MCLIVISPFTSHQSLGESRDWLIFLFVDTILTAARKETSCTFLEQHLTGLIIFNWIVLH